MRPKPFPKVSPNWFTPNLPTISDERLTDSLMSSTFMASSYRFMLNAVGPVAVVVGPNLDCPMLDRQWADPTAEFIVDFTGSLPHVVP